MKICSKAGGAIKIKMWYKKTVSMLSIRGEVTRRISAVSQKDFTYESNSMLTQLIASDAGLVVW
jgi:hypothetical protein